MTDSITVNHVEAKEYIFEALAKRRTPMLHGSPALGKSDIMRQIAKMARLKVIDLRLAQCDPTDLSGYPSIDAKTGKAGYYPMDTFPLEGDPIPQGYEGWLLFLDELTSAAPAIQAAGYKIILDRQVGQRNLHSKCLIAAAGNLMTDNAIVEEMSTALQSRLIHFELALDHGIWVDWATSHGLDHRITDFIKFDPKQLYSFRPDHTDKTYASPRTWEFAHDWITGRTVLGADRLPILAGTLSEGVARLFLSFCEIYKDLPRIDQIVQAPDTIGVSDETSVLWALMGCVANNAKENNIEPLMKYVRRIPMEFQVMTVKEIGRRNKALQKTKPVLDWIIRSGRDVF